MPRGPAWPELHNKLGVESCPLPRNRVKPGSTTQIVLGQESDAVGAQAAASSFCCERALENVRANRIRHHQFIVNREADPVWTRHGATIADRLTCIAGLQSV